MRCRRLNFALQELSAILVLQQLMISHSVALADRLFRKRRIGAIPPAAVIAFAGWARCGPMMGMAGFLAAGLAMVGPLSAAVVRL